MRAFRSASGLALPLLLAAALAPAPAAAQVDFYKGKTIDLVISTGVGGGLDANARVVARHLADHIPGNPTIVPRNMPGAGHIRAANFVFSQAPKDGTVIATFIPVFVLAQVLDRSKGIQFDPANFNWLASTSSSNTTVYTWHTANVRSVADATKRDVLMGGTGVGSYTIIYPSIMNSVLGTRFKLVTGYQSTAEIGLAMERGEVEGRAGNNFNSLKAESAEWLKSGKIVLISQIGLERDAEYPDLPLLTDMAKSDEDRQVLKLFSTDVVIGRPFVTSPGVPAERVALLRKAFDEMMKDPAYLEDSSKAALDVTPVAGAKIQAMVADLVHTPADIVNRAKLAMEPKNVVERPK
ncbi:MAG TPA: tripartite tricarboxylate transporter substrate-binding protein [Xanthobacteraceae bacterium]|jgi:tripartite-type tricarboxylate transporter receptor subunit TctC